MTVRAQIVRLLALGACLVAAGCGSEEGEPIPAEQATALQGQLDSIERRFLNGEDACRDITEGDDTNTEAVDNILTSLPEDVDPDVRDAVTQSFERLFELTSEQCVEETPTDTTPTETQTTTTETIETETVPTDTIETETVPTDTTPTDTTGEETSPGGDQGDTQDGNGGGFGVPGGDE